MADERDQLAGTITSLRELLNKIDGTVLDLLAQRQEIVQRVGAAKRAAQLPTRDPARERWLLRRLAQRASERGLDPGHVRRLYALILRESVDRQRGRPLQVGYQGGHGSFSEMACIRQFAGRPTELRPELDFATVVEALDEGRIDRAVLPLRNTVLGPIADVHAALHGYPDLEQVDERQVRVELCVMATESTPLEALTSIHSQRQALDQCRKFLRALPCEVVEASDTGLAAQQVLATGDPQQAALAGPQAAAATGLHILARDVADVPGVHTVFGVFRRRAS